jgi:hypothetical protein
MKGPHVGLLADHIIILLYHGCRGHFPIQQIGFQTLQMRKFCYAAVGRRTQPAANKPINSVGF